MTFKVELSKWEMEVALMHIELCIPQQFNGKKKMVNESRKHLGT
jgi:hypothetical protein